MKKALCLIVSLLAVATSAWAESAAHCPAVSDIKIRGGIYTAAVADGGEWMGVEPARGPIERFDMAMFFPARNTGRYGQLAKCSYNLRRIGGVNLYFKPDNTDEPKVRLSNTAAWERKEHAFGPTYYECRQSDPRACAFLYID